MYKALVLVISVLLATIQTSESKSINLKDGMFDLSILHFNDFHARFEPIDVQDSGRCRPGMEQTCVGGFARLYTLITRLKEKNPQALVLNAGDVYTGTLWFNLFKWNVTSTFINKIPQDAMTIGNHEFDFNVEGLTSYLKLVTHPVVAANIDASMYPELSPLFKKSTIVKRGNKRIGIIGYVTRDYYNIASIGKIKILDEITSVNTEAERLVKEDHVDIIIVLSHAGVELDQKVAAASKYVSIIVGGHSHTFLYSGKPPCPYDQPKGPYPIVVTSNVDSRKVLVVQAMAYTRYLGNINLKYNSNGELSSWSGAPIFLDKHIQQDPKILKELQPWKEAVDKVANEVHGLTAVYLDASHGSCYTGECNIGYMLMDAMIYEQVSKREVLDDAPSWTYASIAVFNSGGIRSSIQEGTITFQDMSETIPFNDNWSTVEIRGANLIWALEFASADENFKGPLQFYGVKAIIDYSKKNYSRVSNVKVLCSKCRTPRYLPLKQDDWYRVVLPHFVYDGGDGYNMFKKNTRNLITGRKDIDILSDYLKNNSPIVQDVPGNLYHIHQNTSELLMRYKPRIDAVH